MEIRIIIVSTRLRLQTSKFPNNGYFTQKNKTKQNKTKQNKTKQNKTKQNKTKQNKTKQNKTKQNKTKTKTKNKDKNQRQKQKQTNKPYEFVSSQLNRLHHLWYTRKLTIFMYIFYRLSNQNITSKAAIILLLLCYYLLSLLYYVEAGWLFVSISLGNLSITLDKFNITFISWLLHKYKPSSQCFPVYPTLQLHTRFSSQTPLALQSQYVVSVSNKRLVVDNRFLTCSTISK